MLKDLIGQSQNRANLFLKRKLGWLPARIALGLMAWLGFVNMYAVRVNLSIAILAMAKRNVSGGRVAVCVAGQQDTNNGTLEIQSNSTDSPISPTAQTDYEEGDFSWDEATQGWILGAFYYGYLLSQVVGGRLAELYGAKIVFGSTILAGGISALLSPLFAKWHYGALIALRVLQGFFQGPSRPAMHACITRWIPPVERTTYAAVAYNATTLSTAITLPLAGLIIANHGWEAQFYVLGGLSLLWCCVWFSFMYNTPQEHPRISKEEENYIVSAIRESGTKNSISRKVPWKAIFTSLPVWSIFIFAIGHGWGNALFLTKLPTYMQNVLGFSVKSNGTLSAMPFVTTYVGGILWGVLSSYLMSKKYFSLTNLRRAFMMMALGGAGLALLGVALSGCNATVAIVLLCLVLFCNSASTGSGFILHTDIAPNFAGTLLGMSNTIGTMMSCIVPVLSSYITHGEQTLEAWQTVFWICVPVYIVTAIFSSWFLSGEVQPWNDIDSWNSKTASTTRKSRDDGTSTKG